MLNLIMPVAIRLQLFILRLRDDKRGIETLEWAVIAAVVIVGAVAAYNGVEDGVSGFFKELGVSLEKAGTVTV